MSFAADIQDQEEDLRLIVTKRKKKMKAYLEGSEAYHDKKKFKDNPYPPQGNDYYRWAKGFFNAQKKEREK